MDALGSPATGNSGFFRRAAAQSRADPCGSASTRSTRLSRRASASATWIASVVLPTPPFWLRKLTIMDTCQKCGFAELRFSAYHHLWKSSNTDVRRCGNAEIQKGGDTTFRLSPGKSAYAVHRGDACQLKSFKCPQNLSCFRSNMRCSETRLRTAI